MSVTADQLTRNNTSASDKFKPWGNGCAPIGNVSELPIQTLFDLDNKEDVFAHLMPWWSLNGHPPGKAHPDIGYDSSDPAQIAKQMQSMRKRGCTGIIMDWYGDKKDGECTRNWLAASVGSSFKVCLAIDKGIFENYNGSSNITSNLISLINLIYKGYAEHDNYWKIGSRPVIGVFEGGADPDWKTIRKSIPTDVMVLRPIHWNDGVSEVQYMWGPRSGPSYYVDSYKGSGMSKLQAFIGGISLGFNDKDPITGIGVWGAKPYRYSDPEDGNKWLDRIAAYNAGRRVIKQTQGSNFPVPLQIITWNDYEEGTEVETGIQTSMGITANVVANYVEWAITGNTNAFHHAEVWVSANGVDFDLVHDGTNDSTNKLDWTALRLAPGKQTFLVKAIAKPFIHNAISSPVVATVPDVAPVPTPVGEVTTNLVANQHYTSPLTLQISTTIDKVVKRWEVWSNGQKVGNKDTSDKTTTLTVKLPMKGANRITVQVVDDKNGITRKIVGIYID